MDFFDIRFDLRCLFKCLSLDLDQEHFFFSAVGLII